MGAAHRAGQRHARPDPRGAGRVRRALATRRPPLPQQERPVRRRDHPGRRSRSARATRSSSARTRASAPTRRSRAWPSCSPAFAKDGTITAGVGLADLRRRLRGRGHERGEGRGAGPDRRSPRSARTASSPAPTPPCRPSRRGPSARPAARRASTPTDLDLVELNEAFAAVGIVVHARTRHRPGEGQRQRRGHRARPPGRHERRPDRAAPRPRAAAAAAAASVPPPCAAAAGRATP